jgi:cyclic pyranopterin phosphate synthase
VPPKKRSPELTHLDAEGAARMVDVSGKAASPRTAAARAVVNLGPAAWSALDASENRKGDALAVARLAGIQAAKRASDWIPLCHPLVFDGVDVALTRHRRTRSVEIVASVRGTGKTGYEMEAMVAAAAAALTVYDMCKGAEKGIVVGPIELLSKTGGKSGDWIRPAASGRTSPRGR